MKPPKSGLLLAGLAIAGTMLMSCATGSPTADQNLRRRDDAARVRAELVESVPEKDRSDPVQRNRNADIPVPLTRVVLPSGPRYPESQGDPVKDVARPDVVVCSTADSGDRNYVIARISLKGPGDDLIEQVTRNQERLFATTVGVLSSKTLEEIQKPGSRLRLSTELARLFDDVLGAGSVSEVIISELRTQQQ